MKLEIAKIIFGFLSKRGVKLDKDSIEKLIEIPPNSEMGDFAFPCFVLAKDLRKAPQQIAEDLAVEISKSKNNFEKVQAQGPYVNFFVKRGNFAEDTIKTILKEKGKYGMGTQKGKVMTEFCHANTHKAFHIGHTRNISLGESVSRILEFSGLKVIRTNYQGDIGMHVAKTLWGLLNLKKIGLKEPTKDKGKWLGLVYAKASAMAKDEKINAEVNEINQKLYAGDKKLIALWKKTRQWSIDYFEKTVYPDFQVKFNRFYFESEVEKKGISIVKELEKKGVAKVDRGAVIMDYQEQGMGIYILLKSDGTPLYSTKDLALAELQNKEYNPDKILHIVASEQNLYFRQLIKTLEFYDKKLADKEKHMSYELVILPSGKMASREGNVILYDDTLAKLISLIEKEIKQRDSKISKKELDTRARKIALCAVKYAMLSQDIKRTIVFNEEEITRFDGNTGPYIQYSYARASSILKKVKQKNFQKFKVGELEKHEIELSKKLSEFGDVARDAAEKYNPALIAHYSYELAQMFSEFYHTCPVLQDEKKKDFRLALVESFRVVLKNSLNLLGIETLEEM
ncbi:Arginine--tRNA ligase [uncultured archaeon]|nr:Arginine--tRNA ligase [uncultured archaeon]